MKNPIKSAFPSANGRNTQNQDPGASIKRPGSWFRVVLLLSLLTVSVSGCVSGRLFIVKEQMCDYGDYVHIDFGQKLQVSLYEPVLLERDIYMLLGASPTTREETTDGILASYVFEQLQTTAGDTLQPTGNEIQLDLMFTHFNKKLRLAQIEIGEIPVELIQSGLPGPAELDVIATQVCEFSVNPFSRSVSMDIDPAMLQDLPGREAVIDWIGSPLETLDGGNTIAYEYRLKGVDSEQLSGRISASFDDTGNNPLLVEASFTHYLAHIDLVERKMQLKFSF